MNRSRRVRQPRNHEALLTLTTTRVLPMVHARPVRHRTEQERLHIPGARPRSIGMTQQIGERVCDYISRRRPRNQDCGIANEIVGVGATRILERHLVHIPTLPPHQHPGDTAAGLLHRGPGAPLRDAALYVRYGWTVRTMHPPALVLNPTGR